MRQSRTKLVLLLVASALPVIAAGVALATPGEGTVGTLLSRGSNSDEVKIYTDQTKFKTRGPTDILVVTQTWQPVGQPMEVKNYGTTPAVAYFAIVNAPGAPGREDAPNPGCEIP